MKKGLSNIVLCVLLSICSLSCSVPQIAIKPQPPEYEITYFHRTSIAKPAIVAGRVNVLQLNTKLTPLAGAMVSVNNKISYANEAGDYTMTTEPANHSFIVGQIGYYKVTSSIRVAQGDSISLNFYVKEDNRPTVD